MRIQKITSVLLLFTMALAGNITTISAASQGVTSITTYTTPAVPSSYTTGGQTYNWGTGNDVHLNTFTTANGTFSPSILADEVIVRRVDNTGVTGERCRLFVEENGDNFTYGPTYPSGTGDNCDIAKIVSGRIINVGVLDVFANIIPSSGVAKNNIERIDFIFNDGITLSSIISEYENSGHLVTEKSGNNNMIMGAITSLDGSGDPATYAPLTKIWPNSSGEAIEYSVTSFSTLNAFIENEENPPQNGPTNIGGRSEPLGMVFVTADDLGLSLGQVYYGFSYFSQDLYDDTQPNNVVAGLDIIDYTLYPDDTSGSSAVGDADIYGGTAGYFSFNYSISGELFQDTNGNGVEDSETGIGSVRVYLYSDINNNGIIDGNDAILASTDTAPNGTYIFNAASGNYLVLVDETDTDISAGYSISGTNPLNIDVVGVNITGANFPFGSFASISDTVWIDTNEDGINDSGELGFSGATVELYSSTGALINTTLTDTNGDYTFTGITPGDYYVDVTLPSGYEFSPTGQGTDPLVDSDANPTTGQTPVQTLTPGQNVVGANDAGLIPTATISDNVIVDTNKNGIQDSGELGFSGATVELYSSTGALINTTLTDTNGDYTFTGITPGDYYVDVTLPSGYEFSPTGQGTDPLLNSDTNITTGQTPVQTLTPGQNVVGANDALIGIDPASISDTVWIDTNEDGINDSGELGFSGATVELFNAAGTLINTTLTDTNGDYTFTGITPGDYYVDVTPPTNYILSPDGEGTDPLVDSDTNPTTGQTPVQTLTPGQNVVGANDAGLIPRASISDTVWIDTNEDGINDSGELGFSGATVELYSSTGALINTTLTDTSGDYTFTGITPGDYYVDVTLPSGYEFSPTGQGTDPLVDSDANPTTGQTPVQTLTPGQNVVGANDAGLIPTATISDNVIVDTNKNGIQDSGELGFSGATVELYSSTGALINTTLTDTNGDYTFTGITPGDYYVDVTLPSGYEFSPTGQGTDPLLNSDTNITTGQTPVQTLTPGQNVVGANDALIGIDPASISDTVWIDTNEDGINDSGELGFSGATVELFNAAGTLINTTLTDTNGDYTFTGITPGDYYVDVTPPTNYILSPDGEGTDPLVDSDTNPTTGQTPVQTLTPGQNVVGANDAGLIPRASISDTVWIDTNEDGINDSGELGFSGATVELYSSTGALINTTLTDTNGDYTFTGITPGDYYVDVTPPTNYILSPNGEGTDPLVDSDANPTTGQTPVITLAPATTHTGVSTVGLIPRATITDTIILDANEDGIQNGGELGFSGTTVELYSSTGTLINTTTTDVDGNYTFTNIIPGDYYVDVIPQPGYSISPITQGTDTTLDSDIDPVTGQTQVITLAPGTATTNEGSGKIYENFSTLEGFIWNDINGDGLQGEAELGRSDVSIEIYKADGTLIQTTASTSTGYIFTDLLPGDYYVKIIDAVGYSPTLVSQGIGTGSSIDSDINNNYITSIFQINIGENVKGVSDAGLVEIPVVIINSVSNSGGGSSGGGGGGSTANLSTITTPTTFTPTITPNTTTMVETPSQEEVIPMCAAKDMICVASETKEGFSIYIKKEDSVCKGGGLGGICNQPKEIKTPTIPGAIETVALTNYIPFPNLFQFPKLLPQTGTALTERTTVITNPKIDTTPPSWAKPGTSEDINYWKNTVLPFSEDRNEDEYIVIPTLGVVVPLKYIPRGNDDYDDIVQDGTQIKDFSLEGGKNYLKYLNDGAMQYPGTLPVGLSAGTNKEYSGNTVIFGHSSYWKENQGKYDTIFGLLPTLDEGEEIWVYSRSANNSSVNSKKGAYELRKHTITKSYNTNPSDTQILSQEGYMTPHITLFTCTPIGGITGRWVVQAKLDQVITSNNAQVSEDTENQESENGISNTTKVKLENAVKALFDSIDVEKHDILRNALINRIEELKAKYSQNTNTLIKLQYLMEILLK